MGADLLISTAPVPRSYEETKKRLALLDDQYVIDILVDYGYLHDDDTDEDARLIVEKAIEEIVSPEAAYRRDLAVMHFGDREWYVTGGMSWGDEPTDAFYHVWVLEISGVTDDEHWDSMGAREEE